MDIPYLDVDLRGDNFGEDMMKVFDVIRPSWLKEDIVFKILSGGYNNALMKCHLRADVTLDDVIVVRLYARAMDYAYTSRNQEVRAMQLSQLAGCFPKLLAIFHNGVAYEYFHGRTLDGQDLMNPEIIRCITHKLAQYKSIDPGKHMVLDHEGNKGHFDMAKQWELKMAATLETIPDRFGDEERQAIFSSTGMDRDTLRSELDFMHQKLRDLSLPVCLGHSDTHVNNIVYNDTTKAAILLDYEFSQCIFEYVDFVTLLSVNAIWRVAGFLSPDCPDFPDSVKSLWIRNYVERKYELLGSQPSEIPEVVFDKAEIEFALAEIYHTLQWCLTSIQHADFHDVGLQVLGTLPVFKDLYYKRKQRLPELEKRYRQLTADSGEGISAKLVTS